MNLRYTLGYPHGIVRMAMRTVANKIQEFCRRWYKQGLLKELRAGYHAARSPRLDLCPAGKKK
jgi:hypothetical protein